MARRPTITDSAPLEPLALDLGQLSLFVGQAATAHVQKALEAKGHGDLRTSHGYVIQQLVAGPRPIGELAERLGVSQQAISKSVSELEALGYLERAGDDGDKRVSRVGLTAHGKSAVQAARKLRAALEKKLEKAHGERAMNQARTLLAAVLETLGGADAVRERRVRPPR